MLSYCFKCRKNSESKNPEFPKMVNLLKFLKPCYYPDMEHVAIKKFKFIKEQEASELLSELGIRTLLSKIPLLGDILF